MISMFKVLPLMKKHGKGIILNIASRSGSLDLPGTLSYSVSKTAVIRAVGCIQLELDMDGLGDAIQVYALHPGGVLTDMPQSTSLRYMHSNGFSTHGSRCCCGVPRTCGCSKAMASSLQNKSFPLRGNNGLHC